MGYHELEIECGGERVAAHLVVCPQQAYLPAKADAKYTGIGVFLPGVRDAKTWGCGDFRALAGIAEWSVEKLGASYIALNPLHAIHNRIPYNTSPYLPNSLLYRNFIYLDIESVPDFAESAAAQAIRKTARIATEIAKLNASEFVDYEGVAHLKRVFLKHLFRSFWTKHWTQGSARSLAFRAFLEVEAAPLANYALHCALDEHFHRLNRDVWNFPQWPAAYQNPRSPECQEFAAAHARTLLFHQYVQWLLDVQAAEAQKSARAAGMTIGLFHDLPLATDRLGSELWSHAEFYVGEGGVGAPPDAIAPHGQDWGFPPPNREAHRSNGYRHFAHTIRASAKHGGAIRIDHVMRLFRLYCIPAGKTAMDGVYVKDFAADLLKVLALESLRGGIVVIGEDLGTVSPGVREALSELAVLSYRLLYFEREGAKYRLPNEYPALALVSTTTHDLPTLAGYWKAHDVHLRRELGLIGDDEGYQRELRQRTESKQGILEALIASGMLPKDFSSNVEHYPELTGELHNAIVGFLASTPSMLLTINQEDVTKDELQQNLPATVHQHPNWRRKMKYSVEELKASPDVRDFSAMVRHWTEATGRLA
jgi:4-alpha-glucanotransferase